jgi:hypothetical protein
MDNTTNVPKTLLSGFVGAAIGAAAFLYLTRRAIPFKDVGGHTEFKLTPRSYNVPSDLGGVTGAQATLHARANAALGQCLLLLDGLFALSPKSARQDLDSLGGIVRSRLTELVHELGEEGGPHVSRVDRLFTALLGDPPPANCTRVGGEIGALRSRFDRSREFTDTVDDEQNQTNFIVFVDYVISLQRSWSAQKTIFGHNT